MLAPLVLAPAWAVFCTAGAVFCGVCLAAAFGAAFRAAGAFLVVPPVARVAAMSVPPKGLLARDHLAVYFTDIRRMNPSYAENLLRNLAYGKSRRRQP